MKRIALVIAIAAMAFVGLGAPADATPVNTTFDKNIGSVNPCTVRAIFKENASGYPQAAAKIVGSDPSGVQCYIFGINVVYDFGGTALEGQYGDQPCWATSGQGDFCWSDNDVWHYATYPVADATVLGIEVSVVKETLTSSCTTSATVEGNVNDGVSSGYISFSYYQCP
jgi:hypothetical protein